MGMNDHLPLPCPACGAACALAADLEALLADNHPHSLTKDEDGYYDVSWFDGLPQGVTAATLAEAVRDALAEKQRLEAEDDD